MNTVGSASLRRVAPRRAASRRAAPRHRKAHRGKTGS
jgi:hypothetical protein